MAMDAKLINVGKVIEDLEPSLDLVDCENPVCRLNPSCRLKSILSEATAAFMGVLSSYTLADLVRSKKRTRELLGVESE